MNILLIGSGGREHALAWKIAQSPLVDTLYCAPGNPGMAALGTNIDLKANDIEGIVAFARDKAVDLVAVGPEDPLAAGLADALAAAGVKVFGPAKAAAALEASKGFMKDLCKAYDIPTAAYGRFSEAEAAKRFLDTMTAPYVVKADGLAAGKGVVIAQTRAEAEAAIDEMMAGRFGDAGAQIVIEEFMEGEEASFFAITDGARILPLIAAQDHKRVGEGDTGPNTGGMGAYSPAPVFTDDIFEQTMDRIIRPTVKAMADKGAPFQGVLYAGLMVTAEGPKLVEYNVRFGDPECQILMRRMESDIVPILLAAAEGRLDETPLQWKNEAAVIVVLAAKGYPDAPEKGSVIKGVEAAAGLPGVEIFHAGTAVADGALTASGGRVLSVTTVGADVKDAVARAYAAVDAIDWPEGFCRRDIAWRVL